MSVKLESKIRLCKKCDLCNTRINAVPGKGNFNSDVIFIGEAPGKEEDKKGEPFVGFAGRKLDVVLEYAGISRELIYITNVVKCRPPNNRIPTELEKKVCQEYLRQEINIIKPKVICIMGNTAFSSILNGSNITKNRGKIIKKNSMIYFVTIHPAATIYNQGLMEYFKADMRKLFWIIRELKNGKKIKIDIDYTS